MNTPNQSKYIFDQIRLNYIFVQGMVVTASQPSWFYVLTTLNSSSYCIAVRALSLRNILAELCAIVC